MSNRREERRPHYRGDVLIKQISTTKETSVSQLVQDFLAKSTVADLQSLLNVVDASKIPRNDGTGASGTWGINVGGWAAALHFGGDANFAMSPGVWAGTTGFPGYVYGGSGNSRFGFSGANGKVDVYTDGEYYANEGNSLVLHAANFNNYSPTLTGVGAGGNWNIGITGLAAKATELRPGAGQGIVWPNDTYGGSGDTASITMQTNGGETTRVVIKVTNDADDGVDIIAPTDDSFLINGHRFLTSSTYNSYVPTLAGVGAYGTWNINTTGSAGSVDWAGVQNKPTSYNPSYHQHSYSELINIPSTFTPSAHRHNFSDLDNLPTTLSAHNIQDAINVNQKGVAGGVVPLDGSKKISAEYLPSYVDDVQEYPSVAALPATGESGKIYITTDTNPNGQYRWTGSGYLQLNNAVSTSDTTNRLATARTISAYGDGTWSVSFNGSGDVSGQFTLSNVIAAGAINNSDSAIQSFSVDSKGRVIGVGNYVPMRPYWGNIQDKPTAFNPTAHGHDWSEIGNKPATYIPSWHQHSWNDLLDKPSTFTPSAHTHDFSSLTNKPTNLNGYGIGDACTDARATQIEQAATSLAGRVSTLESWKSNFRHVYPIAGGFFGKPAADVVVLIVNVVSAIRFEGAMAGSIAKCRIAPTTQRRLPVYLNGSVIGHMYFDAGQYTGYFTGFANVINIAEGSVIEVRSDGAVDNTFADLYFTLKGWSSYE